MKQTKQNLITRNKKIFSGEPIIKGTRIPVSSVLGQMGRNGGTAKGIKRVYPQLTKEQITAVLEYAKP